MHESSADGKIMSGKAHNSEVDVPSDCVLSTFFEA
jgi:hypothetical protein